MSGAIHERRLLADRMLGKLARILRMVGQDVEYAREGEPVAIAQRARDEDRVLLTRDTRLLRRGDLGPVVHVQSNYPFHQARQVIRELSLVLDPTFRRCVEDNGLLLPVPRAEAEGLVPPYVFATQIEFMRCERCQRLFWAGTHLDGMRQLIDALEGAPLVLSEEDEPATSGEGEVYVLEPLVDLHQALEVQLLEHRLALMRSDLPVALKDFRRFSIWLRRHIQDEVQFVLPIYADLEPESGFPRGAAPAIFDHDHEKLLEHLDKNEAALESLKSEQLEGDALRVACLRILDRQKTLVDLGEHHDRRERTYLYPTLERALSERVKLELVEQLVGPAPLSWLAAT
ncbi:MAG: Mut7-C RNAse domain-containing protein [Deltaproteobacteria bacterium]|nr:Mut7-C RNAse domain-containing protein [Deltaproteobacteria bacterium]